MHYICTPCEITQYNVKLFGSSTRKLVFFELYEFHQLNSIHSIFYAFHRKRIRQRYRILSELFALPLVFIESCWVSPTWFHLFHSVCEFRRITRNDKRIFFWTFNSSIRIHQRWTRETKLLKCLMKSNVIPISTTSHRSKALLHRCSLLRADANVRPLARNNYEAISKSNWIRMNYPCASK